MMRDGHQDPGNIPGEHFSPLHSAHLRNMAYLQSILNGASRSNRRPPACKFGWDGGGWCRLGSLALQSRFVRSMMLVGGGCFRHVCLAPASSLALREERWWQWIGSMLRNTGRRLCSLHSIVKHGSPWCREVGTRTVR